MNVLHLFNEIKFSGAETMYASAASLFQSKGIELVAFSTGQSLGEFASKFKDENIETYHKPICFYPFTIKGIKYYANLFRFLKSKNIDVLHIHRNDLYFVSIIAWLANTKCIKTQHSYFQNRWYTWPVAVLRRFILRKLFKVTFHSIGESVYKNELNYYKNPSICIHNWYDQELFYPADNVKEKIDIRNKLNIDKNAYLIITTGSCSKNKNHHDVIKAMKLIENSIQNLIYLHLGTGQTELEEKELASRLGVFDSIRYFGNQKNVRDYLIASDVYIMPSEFEGLGNAALEAMACKIPTILYDSPGLRDLVDNDDNGFLIPPNHEQIAEKVLFYYKNPEIATSKSDHALEFVNDRFSIEKNVLNIVKLYGIN